jgi:hypothetical protein
MSPASSLPSPSLLVPNDITALASASSRSVASRDTATAALMPARPGDGDLGAGGELDLSPGGCHPRSTSRRALQPIPCSAAQEARTAARRLGSRERRPIARDRSWGTTFSPLRPETHQTSKPASVTNAVLPTHQPAAWTNSRVWLISRVMEPFNKMGHPASGWPLPSYRSTVIMPPDREPGQRMRPGLEPVPLPRRRPRRPIPTPGRSPGWS